MNRDFQQNFEELLQNYIHTIENNCLDQLKRAKDKPFVLDRILNQTRGMIRFYSLTFAKHNKAFNFFIENYNRGKEIIGILNKISEDYPEAMQMAPEIDERDQIELIPFSKEAEKLIKQFPENSQNIVRFHIGYLALDEVIKKVPTYLNQSEENVIPASKKITHWTAPKDAKNDFVQLIYGLHLAGYLNDGKGEITKITEALADTFGVDLGKNWQSNHSSSIHKAKEGYQPPIFDKIKQAYLAYSKGLVKRKDE